MQDLIRRMADVANELDELGLSEQASRVDAASRELTSQIGDGLGWDLAPGLGMDDLGGDDLGGEETEDEEGATLDQQVRRKMALMQQQLGDPATWTDDQKREFLQQGSIGAGRQQAIAPNTSAVPAA